MTNYSAKKTLDDDNQFIFTCPIFETDTKMASCMTLREKVWRGDKPDVRKGCQMCMAANKCPVNNIIKDMMRHLDSDPYHAAIPKKGRLQERHLAQIERTIINERDLERAMESGRISPAEHQKMVKANQNARTVANKGVRNAQEIDFKVELDHVEKRSTKVEKGTEEPSAAVKAAMSGDMSAAVNKAMEEAA